MKRSSWLNVAFLFGGFALGGIVIAYVNGYECRTEQALAGIPVPAGSYGPTVDTEWAVPGSPGTDAPHACPCDTTVAGEAVICEVYGPIRGEDRCIRFRSKTAFDCLRWAGALAASFRDKGHLAPDDLAVLRPLAQACRVPPPGPDVLE